MYIYTHTRGFDQLSDLSMTDGFKRSALSRAKMMAFDHLFFWWPTQSMIPSLDSESLCGPPKDSQRLKIHGEKLSLRVLNV